VTACFAVLAASSSLHAYAVLTHEAIIDTVWEKNLRPLLLKRYPSATPDELRVAHAHVYAGAIIQDLGYIPFGNPFFSDLTHYVRSGDFIIALIHESQTLNEYAFALGSLAHYAADTQGHSIAVNRSVPIQYPKLAGEYGAVVTYAENKSAHLKVEFSFDVLQVARGHYAPEAYRDFIGFEISKELLERAFYRTYNMQLKELFFSEGLALSFYHTFVTAVMPSITRVAWTLKEDELTKATPGIRRRQFVYNISRASYRRRWGNQYKAPGFGTRVLAFFIRILPKIGPLKALSFPTPTAQTESLFELSFNNTVTEYTRLLNDVGAGRLVLPSRDFDTGALTRPGEYTLADATYSKLVRKLAKEDPASISPQLRSNILNYYSDLSAPFDTKRHKRKWNKTIKAVEKLRRIASRPSS
jgi:hypothetical protein